MTNALTSILNGGKKYTATIAVFLALLQFAVALQEIEVYRLIAYEENNQVFGSKITSFNLVASHFSGDLLRKLAVIHFSEVTEENFSQVFQKRPSGLLVILSDKPVTPAAEQSIWETISKYLASRKVDIPVYFSKGSYTVNHIYEKLASAAQKKTLADESKLHFILKGEDPTLLNNVQLEDFSFLLDESIHPSKFSTSTNPIILLVGSYDSFSLIPDLNLGFNEDGSGAVGLIYIARHLSRLLSQNPKTKYNVLFYLTSSSNFKYEGLQLWLNRAENAKIVNKIEYAMFLNSIASDSSLKLQLLNTETLSNDSSYQIFKKLNQTSTTYGKDVKIIRTADTMFGQRFPVLKFSDIQSTVENIKVFGSSAHQFSNISILNDNLLFLTEFLTNTIYDITTDYRILDSNSLDNEYLSAVIEYFSSASRFPTHITRDSDFTKELFNVLQTVNKTINKNHFTYAQPKYFTSKSATLQVTKSSSAFLDFYIFCGVVAWLAAVYFVLNFGNKDTDSYKKSK